MNKAEKIKTLNDRARRAVSNAFISNGIKALGDKDIALIIDKVKNYENFNKGNDPYGEHETSLSFVRTQSATKVSCSRK